MGRGLRGVFLYIHRLNECIFSVRGKCKNASSKAEVLMIARVISSESYFFLVLSSDQAEVIIFLEKITIFGIIKLEVDGKGGKILSEETNRDMRKKSS